jgi:hypothetical protein
MHFIIYLIDLPYSLDHKGKLVLYADDPSVLITAKNDAELKNKVKPVLASMIEWFSANGVFCYVCVILFSFTLNCS